MPLPGFVKRRAEVKIIHTALRSSRLGSRRSTASGDPVDPTAWPGSAGRPAGSCCSPARAASARPRVAAATALRCADAGLRTHRAVDRPGPLARRRVRRRRSAIDARRGRRRLVGPAARRPGAHGGGLGRRSRRYLARRVRLGRRRADRGRGAVGRPRPRRGVRPQRHQGATPSSGEWDVVVVDCAPTAETHPLPVAARHPRAGTWTASSRSSRRVNKVVSPVLSRVTSLPVAGRRRVRGRRAASTTGSTACASCSTDPAIDQRPARREPRADGDRRGPPHLHVPVAVRLPRRRGGRQPPAARRGHRSVVRRGGRRSHAEHLADHRGGVRAAARAAGRAGRRRAGRRRAAAGLRRRASTATSTPPPCCTTGEPLRVRPQRRRASRARAGPAVRRRDDLELGRHDDELLVRVGPYRRVVLLPTRSAGARSWARRCARAPSASPSLRGARPHERRRPVRRRRRRRRGWGPWPSDDDEVLGEEVGDDTGPLHSSERVERGVEALQAAARELIRAARTVLDAAEGVVDDPDAVVHLVGGFADLARNALRTDWVGGAGRRAPGTGRRPRATRRRRAHPRGLDGREPRSATPRRGLPSAHALSRDRADKEDRLARHHRGRRPRARQRSGEAAPVTTLLPRCRRPSTTAATGLRARARTAAAGRPARKPTDPRRCSATSSASSASSKDGFDRSRTRGLAIFSCCDHGLWRVVPLPVPVRDQRRGQQRAGGGPARVGRRGSRPLRRAAASTSSGPACSCSSWASSSSTPSSSTSCRATTTFAASSERGDAQQPRRRLGRPAPAARRRAGLRVFQRAASTTSPSAAPDELVPPPRATCCTPTCASATAAASSVSPTASLDDIRHAATDVEARVGARQGGRAGRRLREAVGTGRRGVAGLPDTLAALAEHRSTPCSCPTATREDGWRCPAPCKLLAAMGPQQPRAATEMDAVDDVVEEAVEEALTPVVPASRSASTTPTSTCWAASAPCSATDGCVAARVVGRRRARVRARPRRHEAARRRRRSRRRRAAPGRAPGAHAPRAPRRWATCVVDLADRAASTRAGRELGSRRVVRSGWARPASSTASGTLRYGAEPARRHRRTLRPTLSRSARPARPRSTTTPPAPRGASTSAAPPGAQNHSVLVTLGTGIGAGHHREGRVAAGRQRLRRRARPHGRRPRGPPCPCGRRGCWERYASGSGLGRLAREAAHAGLAEPGRRPGRRRPRGREGRARHARPRPRATRRRSRCSRSSAGGWRSAWPTSSTSSTPRSW